MASTRSAWRSGGPYVALALALVLATIGWRVAWMLRSSGAVGGAGSDARGHGFELIALTVPPEQIIPSGVPRDGISALVEPESMPATEVREIDENHRGKYLVSDDLVVGVVVGTAARAYPVRVLDWHEAINDSLGGVSLIVTRSPLSQSAAVYERSIGGAAPNFGISGLLVQSNPLLYDRSADAPPSLWSQLDGRAIAGPAARDGLRLIARPASLARWSDWLARHPQTTVLRPELDRLKRYQRNPYGSYRSRGQPRFPVDPLPPEDGPPLMAQLLLLDAPGGEQAWLLPDSVPARQRVELDGATIELSGREPPLSVLVEGRAAVRYSAWFAWFARHPERIGALRRWPAPDAAGSGPR